MRRGLRERLKRWWRWVSGERGRAYAKQHAAVVASLVAARVDVERITRGLT